MNNFLNRLKFILFLLVFIFELPRMRAELFFSTPVKKENIVFEIQNKSNFEAPPHDYGDRTKLSAFILCAMLGFTGAHHFYMKRYFSGGLQLSFFLASTILSIFGSALFFSWLFILALFTWVAADLLLIIFGGLRLKKGKKLIPFEQQF